jgi:hypothetical protein
MAILQSTSVTGSLVISGSVLRLPILTNAQTSSFTSTTGSIWYNSDTNRINYSAPT